MLAVTLGGCRVELRFSFFALLAFCCLFLGDAGGAPLLFAVLFHEAAHIAALFLLHAPPRRACFSALGCRLVLDEAKPLSYLQSAAVSLAGPMCSLLSGGAARLLLGGENTFVIISLTLGLFHSLPIEPLDGGLALRSLLSRPLGEGRAESLSFCLSILFLLPIAVMGFLILLRTRYNFTLLALSVYLMLYLVLKRDFFSS